MSDPVHVLVVDDDSRLRGLLNRFLSQHDYLVSEASDAAEAARRIANFSFDLIILDIMMPGIDGMEFTRQLRAKSDIPVLLLTARGEATDRILGLEAGADDYLVKPFEPRELILRVATILRRTKVPASHQEVRFGPFSFDPEQGVLQRDDQAIHLTTAEMALMRALAAQPSAPISRFELGEKCQIAGSDRAIDVQMARLRRKIEDDPRRPRYLLTMRGAGYVLRATR